MAMKVSGCQSPLGTLCEIERLDKNKSIAQVVGFDHQHLFLMPLDGLGLIEPKALVYPLGETFRLPAGESLLGRVIDAVGRPLDGGGELSDHDWVSMDRSPINPLQRQSIEKVFDVGIQSINSLLTLGQGQRVGIFAGSGVGKSSLLSMMTRFSEADICIVGLVGERGREVKEFVDHALGAAKSRSIVIAAPADESPLKRKLAAEYASILAGYYRDQGKHVLLLIDSLTRFAHAQREIGLSVGEPPTVKGYPPSVFTLMGQLVERAGNGHHPNGSLTALYTVLADGDDPFDPIVDSTRAILDGHIVLSRTLAERGHYPAIDISKSVSRLMSHVASAEQNQWARQFKQLLSEYHRHEDLITAGMYAPGQNVLLDTAVHCYPKLMGFLEQSSDQQSDFQMSVQTLGRLMQEVQSTDKRS